MNKFFLKKYQLTKTKKEVKNNPVIFFFHTTNLNSKNKLKIDKKLAKKKLTSFNIKNGLLSIAFKKSIFVNQSFLIKGSLCFLFNKFEKKANNEYENLLNFKTNLVLIAIKLNNKIYLVNQLKTLTSLNYINNFKVLNRTLKNVFKHPYYKTKKHKIEIM